jgi:predicted N-acyltransferase
MTVPSRQNCALHWHRAVAEIGREEWDALAAPLETPFLEWDWLNLLETSGSATAATGWLPLHLAVRSGGRLVAAAPLYLKGHSAGEYVFDHVWANLASRMGLAYYPKMVGMSPFTPVTGYRILVHPEEDARALTPVAVEMLESFGRSRGLSGLSFLFCDPEFALQAEELGYSLWEHQSFLWENRGYGSFDDFLGELNAQARKNIRRERRELAASGITVRLYEGEAITSELMARMYVFYARHNDQFGIYSCKFLTPAFFAGLAGACGSHLILVAAYRGADPVPVAMAMLARKGATLYGRYWGHRQDVPFLHFELCYYAPIAYAIEQGLSRFDPGMGGEHKMRRGFVSVPSVSAHKFFDQRLDAVLKAHIDQINDLERENMDELNRGVPFARRG